MPDRLILLFLSLSIVIPFTFTFFVFFFISLLFQSSSSMESDSLTKIKRTKTYQEEGQPLNGFEALPREIIFDILSKLPISSLVQFKYVCKAWRLIGQDPNLLELYSSRTAEENPCLIVHCDYPIRNQLYFVDFQADYRDENRVVMSRRSKLRFALPCLNTASLDHVTACYAYLTRYITILYAYTILSQEIIEICLRLIGIGTKRWCLVSDFIL